MELQERVRVKIRGGEIDIRPALVEDESFIYSSWLKSYRGANANTGVSSTVYFSRHKRRIAKILERPETVVAIACSVEDPDSILGWVCFEMRRGCAVVHFLYVKQAYRRFGIGVTLLDMVKAGAGSKPLFCSHAPADAALVSCITDYGLTYDPGTIDDDEEDS